MLALQSCALCAYVRGVLQASIYALVSACHDHEVDSSCCPVPSRPRHSFALYTEFTQSLKGMSEHAWQSPVVLAV